MMKASATTIDGYLSRVNPDKRAALQDLRRMIRSAAPELTECIAYGLPAFRLRGKFVMAFGAFAKHCSFFPGDSVTIAAHQARLKKYKMSKGTIQFSAAEPLPAALVRTLVRSSVAAHEGRAAKSKSSISAKSKVARHDPAVAKYMMGLKHPRKKEIEAVREIILGVSPRIHEGIKWNSPSFRTADYFATLNLRDDRVWLILHTGAKGKQAMDQSIADPKRILKWLAKDRCLVTFDDAKDVKSKKTALVVIVRQWLRHL